MNSFGYLQNIILGKMNSPNRRKACQLQIEKQAYMRHINRLEELKSGKSPQQLRRNKQQKKLVQAIHTVRKMHTYNRQYKQKQMKEVQADTKGTDFDKVKSVVTNDFNWPIPTIAPKHKKKLRDIQDQNIKMFQRIIQAKSNVASRNNMYTDRKNKSPLPCISTADFTKLYETSELYEDNFYNAKCLKIKLGKSKRYIKYKLKIDYNELYEKTKDMDSVYFIQAYFGDHKSKSQTFILGQLQSTGVLVKIAENSHKSGRFSIKLVKVLDYFQKKQVCKARLYADIQQTAIQKQNMNYQQQRNKTEQNTIIETNKTSPVKAQQKKKSKKLKRVAITKKQYSQPLQLQLYLQKQKQLKHTSTENSRVKIQTKIRVQSKNIKDKGQEKEGMQMQKNGNGELKLYNR